MKRNTILWADDDLDDLSLMKEILHKNGKDFTILEARNGKDALQILESSPKSEFPCLIILDINMPILDGKETLSIIRKIEEYKDIPLVVFTTSNSELDKMFCRRYNVEMITKPPQYRSLEDAVLRLLDYCKS